MYLYPTVFCIYDDYNSGFLYPLVTHQKIMGDVRSISLSSKTEIYDNRSQMQIKHSGIGTKRTIFREHKAENEVEHAKKIVVFFAKLQKQTLFYRGLC